MNDPPTTKPRRVTENLYVFEFKYFIMRLFVLFFSCFLFVSCSNEQNGDILNNFNSLFAILAAIAGAFVFYFQLKKWRDEMFFAYTNNLHSDDENTRIAAAVSLRSFLSRKNYKLRTIRIIVGLLKVLPNSRLQKTLGDSFSDVTNITEKDFQGVNFYNVLIKPKFFIEHNLKDKKGELDRYIKMLSVDFFEANLTEFNVTHVDFTKAVFRGTRMCSARFKKCILTKGDFKYADLDGVVFTDCTLEGADFKFARRIDKVVIIKTSVIDGKIKEDKFSLIEFLDAEGKYSSIKKNKIVYDLKEEKKKIFVSKLGAMNSYQQMCYDRIVQHIADNYKVEIVTLERAEYRKFGQLSTIKDVMSDCAGALVFAFSYMNIGNAVVHEDLDSDDKEYKKNCSYSSPWIQIETAFANLLKLPTLVFVEKGVVADGVLDDMIVRVDNYLFKTIYVGGLTDDNKNTIVDWYDKVELCELQKKDDV